MNTSHEGRTVEYATDTRRASVFRSCAAQTGLPLEVVCRAAQTGQLGELIAKRSGRIAERRNLRGHLVRTDVLIRKAELAAKQVPPW
jgi:hypothetical protein